MSQALMRLAAGTRQLLTPTWAQIGQVVVSDAASPLAYESEPRTVQLNNGNLLMVYRRGSDHASNDGTVVQRISVNGGATWGSETTVADDASGYDTRNHELGIHRASGRLVVFYSVYNFAGLTRVANYYKTSTDNGATWSGATDVTTLVGGANTVPFGRVVETANGLMATFYNVNKCVVIFSTDGGQTWGNAVTVYNLSQTIQYNEPTAIAVDNARIVIAARIDRNGVAGYYNDAFVTFKSTDGGLTWSPGSEVRFTSTTTALYAAAPADFLAFQGNILTTWISRGADNKFYYSELSADAFFASPGTAFTSAAIREYVASVYANYGTVTSGTGSEFGYPCLQELIGVNQNVLCFWYDMSDGTGTNTRIMGIETPSGGRPQTDPTLFYNMDSITGSTLNDSSGNGISGTITGATQRAGQVGQELYFDGGDYISAIGTTSSFKYIHQRCDFTISFIASLDTPDGAGAWGFLGSSPSASADRGFAAWWEDRVAASLDRTFKFSIAKGTSGTFAVEITVPSTDVVAGQRYHWLITGDMNTVSVYRNNVLVGSGSVAGVASAVATRVLNVGRLNAATPAFPMLGALDQLRIYPHASGPAARAALFGETGL